MGEAQPLSPQEQLRFAREAYENAQDFTLAVEEEFALLDSDTLDLVNRFEELSEAAQGTQLEDHLVGELIASEVEVRTGRCESFADAATAMSERRRQLVELAGRLGISLSSAGTHPWSPWQEQRVIDTLHYRRVEEGLRYVAWRNNTFGLHVHVGIRGCERAIAVSNGLRNYLPELLAWSCSSPFLEGRYTHLHSARTQIFTRMFPRCGVPDVFEGWSDYERYVRFLYDTRSIAQHTQLWWSVRTHLAYPTVEVRICDGQPDLADAQALAALVYSLTARVARAVDEREPLPSYANRFIEENLWRAIRHGFAGELIDLGSAEVRPARAALEELIEWVWPMAEELGADSYLVVPVQNAAQRQIARYEAGESLEAIYADEVVEVVPV